MKKLFSILAVVLLIASLSVSALADDAVPSPTNPDSVAPVTEGVTVTSYSDSTVIDKIDDKALAEEQEVVDVVVDITAPAGTTTVTVTYKNAAKLKGVKHYNGTAWEDVSYTVSGTNVTITSSSFSPFAFIISSSSTSPQTGEATQYVFIAGAVILAAGAAWFFAQSRKVKAN